VFATPNPDGQREFYWITTPYDHSEEELNELVDTQEWHGPFESEQEAWKDARRVADENEVILVPEAVTLSFQADKSAAGKYVFHAIGDGRVIAVITTDHKATAVQPTEGEIPEWMSRQLADSALKIITQAMEAGEGSSHVGRLGR
jgi:hypothetical protein